MRNWPWLALVSCWAVVSSAAPSTLPPTGAMTPRGDELAEEVLLGDALGRLREVPLEGRISLPNWPVAPGRRARVQLERHEIYAPDARIFEVSARGVVEVPRSPRHYFWGTVEGDPGTTVVLSVDPGSGALDGRVVGSGGSFRLEGDRREPARIRVVDEGRELSARGITLTSECSADDLPQRLPSEALFADALGPEFALPSTHTATIAVDTDNEFMSLKFDNDTGAATTYLATLFAEMNVIYERDLNVRLLQGTTYLRTSSQPDPYDESDLFYQLDEFTDYWAANYPGVDRALAMLLSGKSPNPNGAVGIAWVDVLCRKDLGYSVIQVFLYAQQTGGADAPIVGHELGHNFASPHTHCYVPEIDRCYSGECKRYNQSGSCIEYCYVGPTSCPDPQTIRGIPNVRGTLMSYCNRLGCKSDVFHPTVEALIDTRTTANIGVCIFPLVPPDTTPPAVSNVAVLPRLAAPGQLFRIDADATDASGIASVTAYVRDPAEALVATVPMSLVSGATYRGTFDSTGAISQLYSVDIRAVDASSNANETTVADADTFEVRAGFVCDLVLANQTVTTTTTWEACNSITAGDAAQPFVVQSPGHATLRAGNRVVLRNGVSVGAAGRLTVGTDATLVPPS